MLFANCFDFKVVHSERKEEEVEPAGAISKCLSPNWCRLKPAEAESEKSGQQGTDARAEDHSLMKSRRCCSLVNEPTENESMKKVQQLFAIEEDGLLRQMAQKKETDDVRAGRNRLLNNNFTFCIKFEFYSFWNKLQCSTVELNNCAYNSFSRLL